jgi:hypothetical protein
MMTAAETGQLTICISAEPIESVIARAASAAEGYRVLRVSALCGLDGALERSQSGRVLIDGALDALYDSRIPVRDAARALGRLKQRLEALTESGVNIVVLCEARRHDAGPRAHFLHSLCASADRVTSEL